ncbi:HD domain-containing protein [Novosphingobium bradum]|uniref:HD domain-containing protein n=1 Tax=Novosphingobium bradum TaxID=1737444 RepID=A0ABV7IKM2_9SPHN
MDQPPARRAAFTAMSEGTAADYVIVRDVAQAEAAGLTDRLMDLLAGLKDTGGFRIDRLDHSLQSATRALRDGRDEEYVVCALLHDIGDMLAPFNHAEVAAAVLKPYVSPGNHWMVQHHGLFQTYYYAHHFGRDRNARDKLADSPWFAQTVEFCELYDQNCFDPDYDNLPLAHFEPILRRVLVQKT